MRVHRFVVVGKYLLFVDLEQVESNVVRISLNRIGEELNLEPYSGLSHELECQSEPSFHYKNFGDLVIVNKSGVCFEEFQYVVMGEIDL